MAMTRRTFLRGAAATGLSAVAMAGSWGKALAQAGSDQFGTVIDLTRCDGCPGRTLPACVEACRSKNQSRYPQPQKPILNYWPQPTHEDWSDKQSLINRLTPYNWIYVQHLQVAAEDKTVELHVPRRCMHCDNPPCAKLCPFGVHNKMPEGPVVIDPDTCFGGAKCRDTCPWHIPQRQAGVGLYLKIAPTLAGGGVMYKCDFCYDLILQGREPACVSACPRQAMHFGSKEDMRRLALEWAEAENGYVYGNSENGGTATFYLSPVPFAAINQAIQGQELDGKPGRPTMAPDIPNMLDEPANLLSAMALAPVAGVAAAGLTVYQLLKGGKP